MKITFLRLGYANNSSSSHSLIFTNKKLKTDEYKDFGWDYFTAADQKSKLNYLLLCLRSSWNAFVNINRWDNIYLDNKEVESMISRQYKKFLLGLGISEEKCFGFEEEYKDGYVDHQSIITFPSYRDISKGLNKEFCVALISELLKDGYAILGGNDNDEEYNPNKDLDLKEKEDIKNIAGGLTDNDPKSILCEKDNKTGEFVLSWISGKIMKVKFE